MVSQEFVNSLDALKDVDKDAFLVAMQESPVVSLKLNRRKLDDPATLEYGDLERVKWCRSGFYLDSRPNFTLNPLLHAGCFYVQDASSMIYETIMRGLVENGFVGDSPLVLDLCAAPGGKTTSMINALPDGSMIVANEFVGQRAGILKENLLKWGYPGIMITNSPTSSFGKVCDAFDVVAVDAPCSGEGMMRKDEKAVAQWSPGLVRQCAALQREILADAVAALAPGSVLIYSTCTFNRTENEENLEWLISEHGLQPIEPADLGINPEWGIGGAVASNLPALRFMPHLTRGEGLFAAVLKKPGERHAKLPPKKALEGVKKRAKVILEGINESVMKGKVEIPASESVLATDYVRGKYPAAELDLDTALRYLHHESIRLDEDLPRGYVVVTYQGFPLGLVKNIGSRANNLYPAQWRIRMDVEKK